MFQKHQNKLEYCEMELHIGQLIKERLDEVGMKKSEFARRINRSSQNVYNIFDRKSIDTTLLYQISLILERNFFEIIALYFLQQNSSSPIPSESENGYISNEELVKKYQQMEKDLTHCTDSKKQLEKEVVYLKEINRLLSGK